MAEGYIESVGAKLGNAMKETHASILKARNDLERHSIEGLNVDVDGSSCEAVRRSSVFFRFCSVLYTHWCISHALLNSSGASHMYSSLFIIEIIIPYCL